MSLRELVILLLGLAIVAVILRGLYVAIQARRGQLRLAIDKNIPQDVDLEALELAELPGGGARVVARGLDEVNSQNYELELAQARADELNLGQQQDSDSVPVLMDAVELSRSPQAEPAARSPAAGSAAPEPSVEAVYDEEDADADDADDLLLDYGARRDPEVGDWAGTQSPAAAPQAHEPDTNAGEEDWEADNRQQAAEGDWDDDWEADDRQRAAEGDRDEDDPDAEESEWDEEESEPESWEQPADDEWFDDEDYDERRRGADDGMGGVAPDYEDVDEDDEEGWSEDDPEADFAEADTQEREAAAGGFEESLDRFSMTAGERIGGSSRSQQQEELFAAEASPAAPAPKRKSLFSAFSRSQPDPETEPEPPPEKTPAPEAADPVLAEAEAETDRWTEVHPSEVLVINVMAREGAAFHGDDLLQVLVTAGLKFGDMNIFHRRLGNDNKGPVIFSVANVLNPGTFDLNVMGDFSTPGISIFLALPSAINNLDAFEQMLDVAQQVRGALDGELKDDHRNIMTTQTIEHYRQRIRDFELRQLKVAGGRG